MTSGEPRGAADELEMLRAALRQSEERVREERALREELERRKDAQICRLTLQLQPPVPCDAAGAGGAVTVEFEEEGALGFVTDELETGSPGVFVVGVKATGQAARHAALQPGMRIVGVAGRSCAELRYREVTQLIRNHSARPLVLTLEAPPPPTPVPAVSADCGEPEPEPECTAEICEGVPPPEGLPPVSPPPLAALARRLSADAGRVVAGLSDWREQRPAAPAEAEGKPWIGVEKSLLGT